jgi:D-sedoheptulose 7-phosphate isomerase
LTCLANDYGYENVFSEGLKTLFTSKDALIAVSSSGSSQNIRNAAVLAKQMGGQVLTFSGFKTDNPLRSLGDYNFWLNSTDYGKVEIGHALLLHILTDELSRRRMNS